MTNNPFENQRLPVNLVANIEHDIAQGNGVSGEALLGALEQSAGHQLDDRLRAVIRKFSVSAVKRRGRPSNPKAAEDFALADINDLYPALLRKHEEEARRRQLSAAAEGTILPSAERTPSELAYTEILTRKRIKQVFPSIGWMALRNKHSAWKNARFPAENYSSPEDYEAEIDRWFASQPKS